MTDNKILGLSLVGAITLVFIALLWPLAFIWAINHLVPATIFQLEYTFLNWLAVMVIGIFIRGPRTNVEKKD